MAVVVALETCLSEVTSSSLTPVIQLVLPREAIYLDRLTTTTATAGTTKPDNDDRITVMMESVIRLVLSAEGVGWSWIEQSRSVLHVSDVGGPGKECQQSTEWEGVHAYLSRCCEYPPVQIEDWRGCLPECTCCVTGGYFLTLGDVSL